MLEVIRMGHPTLASRAKEVEDPTAPHILEIVNNMMATIDTIGPAAGLAAPQVNIPLRIIIYQVPKERSGEEDIPFTVAINPVIEIISEEQSLAFEGCFSLPYVVGEVPRHNHIRYSYQTLEGKRVTGEAKGFHARVLQHEIDHLDGILYVQRMPDMSRFGYLEEIKKHIL